MTRNQGRKSEPSKTIPVKYKIKTELPILKKNAKKHKDLSSFIRSRTLEVKCKCNS